MGLYKNNNGVLSPIAGRGKAEYGASAVRTGTITLSSGVAVGSYTTVSVEFDSPMPDANYMVYFDGNGGGYGQLMNAGSYMVYGKSTTGFEMAIAAPTVAIQTGWNIKYIAYKLYTDKEYNDILAAMPSNASASNKLVTESSALKVKVKTESITTNSSGYLFLPKGTFAASVDYSSCVLLAWGDNVISKVYINQASTTPSFGTFNPNTAYTVRYHYIE